MSTEQPTLHGTAILLDGAGVLIRGRSGSGKSRLAHALLEGAGCHVVPQMQTARDLQTALIGDDQLILQQQGTTLYAASPPVIAGKLEVRGLGIVHMPWRAQGPVHLVADLTPTQDISRLPQSRTVTLMGCDVPVVQIPIGDLAHQVLLVWSAMRLLHGA